MRHRSPVRIVLFAAALTAAAVALANVRSQSNWFAPDVQPHSSGKVMVLAKFEEESAKRILEDTLVQSLKDYKIDALAAYQTLTPEDLASEEAIVKKGRELGVTAGIVFSVTGDQTEVQAKPAASVSIGIGGYGGGGFGGFLGTSVPLGGGTTTVRTIGVKGEYFVAGERGKPLWIGTFTTDLKAGVEREAKGLATMTFKALKKGGAIKKP
jgi:hypothetical protein